MVEVEAVIGLLEKGYVKMIMKMNKRSGDRNFLRQQTLGSKQYDSMAHT